jgi:hypothetical protein
VEVSRIAYPICDVRDQLEVNCMSETLAELLLLPVKESERWTGRWLRIPIFAVLQ